MMNKNVKRGGQLALLAGSIAAIGMLTTALVVSRRPAAAELTLVQPKVEVKPKQRKFTMGFRAYLIAKRWFDFTVAAMALVALSPLMAMIAVLIKLDSPGPVFFSQERVGSKVRGKNGKRSWEVPWGFQVRRPTNGSFQQYAGFEPGIEYTPVAVAADTYFHDHNGLLFTPRGCRFYGGDGVVYDYADGSYDFWLDRELG